MKTQVTFSPVNGQAIQVVKSVAERLNVRPLVYMGKTISTPSGIVMDDRWIYVNVAGYGSMAINVNRANYCQKMYQSEITIQESIGNKLMDSDLKKFVEKVSDRIVFQKYGKWYRIFLCKKSNRTYGISKIVLYNWTIEPNRQFDGVSVSDMSIDWKRKFFVK